MIPLGIQAYLLQYEGTRMFRMAVGVVGVTLMINAWIGYRFERTLHLSFHDQMPKGDCEERPNLN